MKQVRPFFLLDRRKIAHFCLQEAVLSAVVIALYVMLTDAVEEHIGATNSKWQKYLVSTVVMFVASFVAIVIILTIFGYDCGTKKNPRQKK